MARIGGAALSPRQRKCLELVGEGLTTKEIAYALELSENTVDEHIKKAMAKLGAPTRQRAAAMLRSIQQSLRETDPQIPPQPLGVGTSQVDDYPTKTADPVPALSLHEPDRLPFEPEPLADKHQRPQPGEMHHDQNNLNIIGRILVIAAAMALILLAMPSLIGGAERIAAFILATTKHHN